MNAEDGAPTSKRPVPFAYSLKDGRLHVSVHDVGLFDPQEGEVWAVNIARKIDAPVTLISFDLSECPYPNSAFFVFAMRLHNDLSDARNVELVLRHPTPNVTETLRFLQLDRLFRIENLTEGTPSDSINP